MMPSTTGCSITQSFKSLKKSLVYTFLKKRNSRQSNKKSKLNQNPMKSNFIRIKTSEKSQEIVQINEKHELSNALAFMILL